MEWAILTLTTCPRLQNIGHHMHHPCQDVQSHPACRMQLSVVCRFRLQTAPWALPWQPSLRLRLSKSGTASPLAARPMSVVPLFSGGTFDAGYNQRQAPIKFRTPWGVKKALLYAVITGASPRVLPGRQLHDLNICLSVLVSWLPGTTRLCCSSQQPGLVTICKFAWYIN